MTTEEKVSFSIILDKVGYDSNIHNARALILAHIKEMLGHESIMTTEIYTHLDTDFLKETI